MAYAGAEFADSVIRAIGGQKGIVIPSYVNLAADTSGAEAVNSEIGKTLQYFSVPVELGVCYRFFIVSVYFLTLLYFCSPTVLKKFIHSVMCQSTRRSLLLLLFQS